jgi:hypothetical protein
MPLAQEPSGMKLLVKLIAKKEPGLSATNFLHRQ